MNNLNLIVGTNRENIDFCLQNILNELNVTNENIIRYDLSQVNFKMILDEASMISLFSDKKLIIGNNFDLAKISDFELDYLTKYVNNINHDVYIILITSKVDKRSKTFKVFKDNFNITLVDEVNNEDNLFKYVRDKVNNNGYTISDMDIKYFLSKTGNDINNINSELAKLLIYKCDDKIITMADIELLVFDNIDNVMYEFTNAFFENDLDCLMKMYNNFKLENVGFDYLLSSLSNALRQALIIKLLINNGKSYLEISKVLGKKEFFVRKMNERLEQYSVTDLAKYITKLALIDANYKSGKSNIDELELFLIDKNMEPYQ